MVVVSKELFHEIISQKNHECSGIFHPWHNNCLFGNSMVLLSTVKGSIWFFGPLYLLEYAPKLRKLTKEDVIGLIRKLATSATTASAYMMLYIGFNCFFRKQCNSFQFHIVAYLVPLICGFAIFLENTSRKALMSSSFCSMGVEALIRRIFMEKSIRRNTFLGTILFMICNGLLMYILREKFTKNSIQELWFYMPKDNGRNNDNELSRFPCTHNNCLSHGIKEIMKFTSTSFALSIFKILLTNIKLVKAPIDLVFKIIRIKNLKLSFFVGTYVGVYKALNCFLCRVNNRNSKLYSLIGGVLAGVPYCFVPNLPLLSSLISVLLRVIARKLNYEYKLPNLPYQEISFILSSALLLNTLMFSSDSCPTFFKQVLTTISRGRSQIMYKSFNKIVLDSIRNKN